MGAHAALKHQAQVQSVTGAVANWLQFWQHMQQDAAATATAQLQRLQLLKDRERQRPFTDAEEAEVRHLFSALQVQLQVYGFEALAKELKRCSQLPHVEGSFSDYYECCKRYKGANEVSTYALVSLICQHTCVHNMGLTADPTPPPFANPAHNIAHCFVSPAA